MDKSGENSSFSYHTGTEIVNVTHRSYSEVMHDLRLPDSFFIPGQRILSVGEGLSTFADTLNRMGVNCTAIDSIYGLGKKIFSPLSNKDENSIEEALSKKTGIDISIQFRLDKDSNNESGVGKLAAADVARLPFPDNCFDVITADHITEYVDLERTITELVRVLKPGGEIRLGGVGLRILPHNKIIDTLLQSDSVLVKGNKLDEMCQWLGKQTNLNVWAVLDKIPETPRHGWNLNAAMIEKYNEPAYISGTLIIQKDPTTRPAIGRMDDVENETYRPIQYQRLDNDGYVKAIYDLLGDAIRLKFEVRETRRKNIFQKQTVVIKDGFRVKDITEDIK